MNSTINPKRKTFEFAPHDIIQLPNKNILISTTDSLALFNENFEVLIESKSFEGKMDNFVMTNDLLGDIFIKSLTTKYMARLSEDLEVKKLREINCGCNDITFYDDQLYACSKSRAVTVFTRELKASKHHMVNGIPLHMKIAKDVACVQVEMKASQPDIQLYKLPRFDFIGSLCKSGTIMEHKGLFYILSSTQPSLCVFNAEKQVSEMLVNFRSDKLSVIKNTLVYCIKDQKAIAFVEYF
jgi:hypothetical protein